MAYVKIFSGSMVQVEHIKQSLQAEGLEPIVKDVNNSARLAGFGTMTPSFQELYVHSDQGTAAKNILANL